jgi:hypothetical protein
MSCRCLAAEAGPEHGMGLEALGRDYGLLTGLVGAEEGASAVVPGPS